MMEQYTTSVMGVRFIPTHSKNSSYDTLPMPLQAQHAARLRAGAITTEQVQVREHAREIYRCILCAKLPKVRVFHCGRCMHTHTHTHTHTHMHISIINRHAILSSNITSHPITSHYITLHHIIIHHITSHHITSHHITSHHITSHHITSHHMPSHTASCIYECHCPGLKYDRASIPFQFQLSTALR